MLVLVRLDFNLNECFFISTFSSIAQVLASIRAFQPLDDANKKKSNCQFCRQIQAQQKVGLVEMFKLLKLDMQDTHGRF